MPFGQRWRNRVRDYGKVAPQFWIGQTGKELKAAGHEAVIVGLYLMTCPHANMIGLYYLPVLYIAHETGLGLEGAKKGLERACEAGFCTYDEDSEYVLVHAMARFQIAPSLKASDNRCKGAASELENCPNPSLRRKFFSIYAEAFHLPPEANPPPPLEAPSKPLRSQEQEQEQEQEQKEHESANADLSPEPAEPVSDDGMPRCPTKRIIALYHEVLPDLPPVQEFPDASVKMLRQRWRSDPERQSVDWWRGYFEYVRKCPFLMGEKTDFTADLLWLVRPTNFAKVVNGNYEERAA